MPYTPTWNSPYTTTNPYPIQPTVQPTVQPYQTFGQQHWHPVGQSVKVNGPQSAMQFGYRMPPNSESDPLFDSMGGKFYVVSTDGAGVPSLETFDFSLHKEEESVRIDGAQFVSRQEYDQFVAKVGAALEALNGVHATVSTATGTIVPDSPSGVQGEHGKAKADNAG